METTIIYDEVLHNILSRLSIKPLLRFRCASKRWNSLITDPYFVNSISRRMIIMRPCPIRLYAFDPKHQNMVRLTHPFEHQINRCNIIGTLNGIAVLVLEKFFGDLRIFILYNPLTRATKKLPGLPHSCYLHSSYAYGFGHGNIITIKYHCYRPICYAFSLKKGSWTKSKTIFWCHESSSFVDNVGMFLNGLLYWLEWVSNVFDIVVLDVTKMVFTRMDGPRITVNRYNRYSSVLGMLHGCLCMSNMWLNGFDVWVKEQSEWSKQYSFALPFYWSECESYLEVSILEEGRILVRDRDSKQVIMYHMLERDYDIFKCASENQVTNGLEYGFMRSRYVFGKPFEYVESLVSPSDICHV